jgi:hypothetical protein
MKVTVTVTFDITFDAEEGRSKTTVGFALPNHPHHPISDSVKKLSVEETQRLCQAMLDREVFGENAEARHAEKDA